MPIDRNHAFANGLAYARPGGSRWSYPWRAGFRARVAWQHFDRRASVAEECRLGPNAWCVNREDQRHRLRLERGVICRGLLRVEDFGDGSIRLGPGVYIGDDCLLSAAAGIELEEGVLLAHGVQILDNDSHPLLSDARRADMHAILKGGKREAIESAPVRIERDSWVGLGAIILKGVTIGEGSVVAAGSVVVRDIPAHSVSAGNPARVVKSLAPS